MQGAAAQQLLTVAAFSAVDEIVKAAIPAWNKLHSGGEIKRVCRALADHQTAVTTALAISAHLPDVMAVEVGYLGRFAVGGGPEAWTLGFDDADCLLG